MAVEPFALEFKNLRKSFGSRRVLDGISFGIARGEIVFVLGQSGTGKSVLLKHVVGLLKADEGHIFVQGHSIESKTEEDFFEIRKVCGMCFQHPALFEDLTVGENISYGLSRFKTLTKEQVSAAVIKNLELVGLKNVENLFPREISYGMQKRVSLARTVAMAPPILLFDEPTTGLDPENTRSINKLIGQLSRQLGTASLVVSHDMACAMDIADKMVFLDQGQVISIETRESVSTSPVPLVQEFMKEVL